MAYLIHALTSHILLRGLSKSNFCINFSCILKGTNETDANVLLAT